MGRTIIGINTANAMACKHRGGMSVVQLAQTNIATSKSVCAHPIRLRADWLPVGSLRRATRVAPVPSTPDWRTERAEDIRRRFND